MDVRNRIQPTESELEILQVLWEKGSATVREVYEVLKEWKNTGYTTTLKTMQIMTEKGQVRRDTSSRTHVYVPVLSLEKTQKQYMSKLINGLFRGSAGRLVIGALDNHELTADELQEIKEFLKKIENE